MKTIQKSVLFMSFSLLFIGCNSATTTQSGSTQNDAPPSSESKSLIYSESCITEE